MRIAGAAARAVLIEAAALRLGRPASTLATEDGFVVAPDGQKLSYADLAVAAASLEPPSAPRLKDPADWRYLGSSLPRLDMVAKVTGTAQYAIDIHRGGMLYAAVRCNPHLGGAMLGFDTAVAQSMPGVEQIVDLGTGVGVIATSTWRAMQAVDAVKCDWGPRPIRRQTTAFLQP